MRARLRPQTRKALAIALTITVASALATAIGAILLSKDPSDAAKLAGAVAAVVGPAVALIRWLWGVLTGPVPNPNAKELKDAADRLAKSLLTQWVKEASNRGVTVPAVAQVSWTLDTTGRETAETRPPGAARPSPLPRAVQANTGNLGSDGRARPLTAGLVKRLHDLYAHPDVDKIVITGDAGAGKSGALILLLIEALGRRSGAPPKDRFDVPVPFFVALSQWNPERDSLRAWAGRVLQQERGDIGGGVRGNSLLSTLLEEGRIALFLDGFDELPRYFWDRARKRIAEDTQIRAVLTSRTEAMTATTIPYAAAVALEPVGIDEARRYMLAVSPAAERWEPLFAAMKADRNGPAAKALDTPLMLTLARDAYAPLNSAPAELAREDRFADAATIEEHLLAQIIPTAYERVFDDDGLGRHYVHPAPVRRTNLTEGEVARIYLKMVAEHMGTGRELSWWQIRQWIPWLAPGLMGFVFGTGVGLLALVVGGFTVGAEIGVPFTLLAAVGAGLTAWTGTSWRPRPMKGPRPRMAVALAIGVVFGVCLGLLRALSQGQYHDDTSRLIGLAAIFGLASGVVLGTLALHDGPLVAAARLPSARDIAMSLPLGVATGATYAAIAQPIVAGAIATVATAGFILGVGATRPADRPRDGATPMSSFRLDLRGAQLLGLVIGLTVTAEITLTLAATLGILSAAAVGAGSGIVFGATTAAAASQAVATSLVGAYLCVMGRGPCPLVWFHPKRRGFLEDARRRDVLRCVGSVYQFRHATLQDYLLSFDGSTRAHANGRTSD